MTAFVILAAGRGTRVGRVGEKLHKALLPLNGRAIISHLFDLAPPDARIVIVVGDRSDQIRDYVALAHPGMRVEFVLDRDPRGPGASLLTARGVVGDDDLVFTSCDTLWTRDDDMWKQDRSWVGVAPVPAGTQPERWCRFDVDDDRVVAVLDKVPGGNAASPAYVGLARISAADLPVFWEGVIGGSQVENELQVSGGFDAILKFSDWVSPPSPLLGTRRIHWTDVGDEAGYRRAVAEFTGYDWTKLHQATWVLPDTGRVVKYHADPDVIGHRFQRGIKIGEAVPQLTGRRGLMLGYHYVHGVTAYQAMAQGSGHIVTQSLLEWFDRNFWSRRTYGYNKVDAMRAALRFYQRKTYDRVQMLREPLRAQAEDAVSKVNYLALANGIVPGAWHGDLNFGNIIVSSDSFYGIDWREDFAGETSYGDLRYDVAKLLAGTVVHWDNARRGDFRPWSSGPMYAHEIRNWIQDHAAGHAKHIEIIGALSLLNSAPLHAEPLDEILVARGAAWLEEVL